MKKIYNTDILFVTISRFGSIVMNFRLCGLNSMAEVLKAVRVKTSGYAGLVTVNLRNQTQGWCHTNALLLAA